MSIGDDLENLIFPFDWQAPRYHGNCLIFIDAVIQCIAAFLNTDQEQAENLFLEFALRAEIDIFSLEPGNCTELCLPATREGAAAIFKHCKDFGLHSLYDEQLIILFSIEQVETMVNESIKGLAEPFSVRRFLAANESLKTKAHLALGSTERNTLLVVIAALIEHAGISLERPSKAAGIMAGLTQELGAKVSISTIEKIIKQIPDAVERRST